MSLCTQDDTVRSQSRRAPLCDLDAGPEDGHTDRLLEMGKRGPIQRWSRAAVASQPQENDRSPFRLQAPVESSVARTYEDERLEGAAERCVLAALVARWSMKLDSAGRPRSHPFSKPQHCPIDADPRPDA